MSPWVNLGLFFTGSNWGHWKYRKLSILSCFSELKRIFFKLGKHYPFADCKSEGNYNRQLYWLLTYLWKVFSKMTINHFLLFCILHMPTMLITPRFPLHTFPASAPPSSLNTHCRCVLMSCSQLAFVLVWSQPISKALAWQSYTPFYLWCLDLVFGLGLHGVWMLICSVDEETGLSENSKPELPAGGKSSSSWGLLMQGRCHSSQNHSDKMWPQRGAPLCQGQDVLTSLPALGNPAVTVRCVGLPSKEHPTMCPELVILGPQPLTMPQPLSKSSSPPTLLSTPVVHVPHSRTSTLFAVCMTWVFLWLYLCFSRSMWAPSFQVIIHSFASRNFFYNTSHSGDI